MKEIKMGLYKAFPEIKTREYTFLELDYNEMFEDLIPDYIIKLQGIRIWKQDDGYDIQEGVKFEMGLSNKQVIQRIKSRYEKMARKAEIERKSREMVKLRKEQEKRMGMMQMLKMKENLSTETLEFLVSLM